jgi:hypothetical protein
MQHSNVEALSDRVLMQAFGHTSAACRQLQAVWAAGNIPSSRIQSHRGIMEWAVEEVRLLQDERDRRSEIAHASGPMDLLAVA